MTAVGSLRCGARSGAATRPTRGGRCASSSSSRPTTASASALGRAHRARAPGGVEVVESGAAMEAAVERAPAGPDRVPDPQEDHPGVDLVQAPLPDRAPRTARRPRTLVAGLGDRARGEEWGVTVLEANDEVDAGGSGPGGISPRAPAGKSSLYRHEVRRAAIKAIVEAVARSSTVATPPFDRRPRVTGRTRPLMRRRSGPSTGARILPRRRPQAPRRRGPPRRPRQDPGHEFHLFGVHREQALRGAPARSSPSATARSAVPRSTAPSGSRSSSAAKRGSTLQAPGHARARARRVAARRARDPGRRGPTLPAEHTYREIAYEEQRASATCTSTSTTAR